MLGLRPEQGFFTRHGPIPVEVEQLHIYFYEIANRLGPERVHDWYAECGLDPGLVTGTLPNESLVEDRMIIGIGRARWPGRCRRPRATPARDGRRAVEPKLVLDPGSEESRTRGEWRAVDLALKDASPLDRAPPGRSGDLLDGPREPPRRSAHGLAKTGTAQVKDRPTVRGPRAAGESIPLRLRGDRHGNSGAPRPGPSRPSSYGPATWGGAQAASRATPITWHDEIQGAVTT